MDIKIYFGLLLRRWKEVLVVTVISVFIVMVSAEKIVKTDFTSTIFLSIDGVCNEQCAGFYGGIHAADGFAETVQGWFLDPSLLSTIRATTSDGNISWTARKQEKQNIVVTIYGASTKEKSENSANNLIKEIRTRILQFNQSTGKDYRIGMATVSTVSNIPEDQFLLNFILGIALGLFIGVFGVYMYEFLLNRVSYSFQVKKTLDFLCRDILDISKTPLCADFVQKYISSKEDDPLFIGLNFKPSSWSKYLIQKESSIVFPKDIRNLDFSTKTIYLVVRLGGSRLNSLEKLKTLLQKPIVVIVVQ